MSSGQGAGWRDARGRGDGFAHRALTLAGAAPRGVPQSRADRLDVRRDRGRRRGSARCAGPARPGVGRRLADHAAQARRAPAARRDQRPGGRRGRGQHAHPPGRGSAARRQHGRSRHRGGPAGCRRDRRPRVPWSSAAARRRRRRWPRCTSSGMRRRSVVVRSAARCGPLLGGGRAAGRRARGCGSWSDGRRALVGRRTGRGQHRAATGRPTRCFRRERPSRACCSTSSTAPGRRRWPRPGRRPVGVAVPGLEMLLHQAARQVLAWTGRSPDLDAMRTAARAERRRPG